MNGHYPLCDIWFYELTLSVVWYECLMNRHFLFLASLNYKILYTMLSKHEVVKRSHKATSVKGCFTAAVWVDRWTIG